MHYTYGMGPTLFEDLREAFEGMTDVNIVAEALREVDIYWTKSLSFVDPLTSRIACDGRTPSGTNCIDISNCYICYF